MLSWITEIKSMRDCFKRACQLGHCIGFATGLYCIVEHFDNSTQSLSVDSSDEPPRQEM